MAKLVNLGVNHWGKCYDIVYQTLGKLNPCAITLEEHLFSDFGEMYLGKLFDFDLDQLNYREDFLRENIFAGEVQAGYIFARRNKLPLYFIDSTIISPEKAVQYNITEMENPHEAFQPKINTDFIMRLSMQERNRFMAQVLDLIAPLYPTGVIVHIGGSLHAYKANPESPTPIQNLVKEFDKVNAKILVNKSYN